ncbi:MAG: PH domain-containing protein [Pseudomonadota bacterium]
MEIFSSKIDIPLFVFVSIIAFLNLSVAVGIARSFSVINIASSLLLFVFGSVAPLWLLLSTYYVVKDDNLEIMSGPFSWSVSLGSIEKVLEAEQPLCSPTFSRDQLAIFYDSGKELTQISV